MSLVAAGDILESYTLTHLNNPPVLVPTAGEGASARLYRNEDFLSPTAANVQYSTYTLGPRIPTNAKIKKVQMYGHNIDTNATATFAVDVNLIFSDAPIGGIVAGTPVNDGTDYVNAGQIPTSAKDGTTTSITAYSSPNRLFGSAIVANGNGGAKLFQEITFADGFLFSWTQLPIWDVLGFTQDPGGFFNFFLVCVTASGTPSGAGVLGLTVDYVV